MTNGELITLVSTIINRDLQGESFRSDEYQILINANSKKYFASLLGIPNLYQINAPVERRGAGVSRVIDEKLRPFYRREVVPVVAGVADFSSKNIGYLLAINPTTIVGRPFTELQSDRVADVLGSSVIAPTAADPAFEFRDSTSILVYPNSITSVTLYYYTFPTEAVVTYTTDPTTLLQSYDEANSTETGWKDNELLEIAYMMLRDLGVSIERSDVLQYADNVIKTE